MRQCFHEYTLVKRIASKSWESTYLADDLTTTSQQVILKMSETASLPLPQQKKAFLQKGRRLKQLKHSAIVPLLDLGIEQELPYTVRPYLTSDSLRQWMSGLLEQHLPLQEALAIVWQVGQVLCYAHQHHIVHGNIKPENIFIASDGTVLLSDFRLVTLVDVTKLDYQSGLQTLSYLAPEQLSGILTEKSDQYALACLAYELITGRVLFFAQSFFLTIPLISVEGEFEKASEDQRSQEIDQAVMVPLGSFCENDACPDYGKVGRDNIRKYGKTRRGEQRWQCRTCQTTWSPSSMWSKRHSRLAAFPSSDIANLSKPIEEVLLTAMAKVPSQRYANLSLFLNALQTAASFSKPMVSRCPLAKIESEVPCVTQLNNFPSTIHIHASSAYVAKKHNSEAGIRSVEQTSVKASHENMRPYSSSERVRLETNTQTNTSLLTATPTRVESMESEVPYVTRLSNALSTTHIHASSAYVAKKHNTEAVIRSIEQTPVEVFPPARLSRPGKSSMPVLWLAFALSGFVLLLGTVMLYAAVPSSPSSSHPSKSSLTSIQGTIPKPFDDREVGTGIDQFHYVGNWQYCTSCDASGLYDNTNTWSNTPDDYMTFKFIGTRIKFYTVLDPKHGEGDVSIDGGKETPIDCYASARVGNYLIWTSPILPAGRHILKLRVTGERNSRSSGYSVPVDRVDVFSYTEQGQKLSFSKD